MTTLSVASLIEQILRQPTYPDHDIDLPDEVRTQRQLIRERYAELKGKLSFEESAAQSRCEAVERILAMKEASMR